MNQIKRVVLASASPRRRELLSQAGIRVDVCPSRIEERMTASDPADVVMELSDQKAADIAADCEEGTLVIGADTMVAVEGQILGKPKSHEEAETMISMLSGKTHQVYTGVTLIACIGRTFKKRSFVEKTDVTVYPMTSGEIHEYAFGKEPMDKAGAYGIQGRFAVFIKKIDGDYNNVVGLPVGRVYQEIKDFCGPLPT